MCRTDLLSLSFAPAGGMSFYAHYTVICLFVFIAIVFLFVKLLCFGKGLSTRYEIASVGFNGSTPKITLKPNRTDREIAYKIWVELKTRKIGLIIDLEHDVILEIYNSWYAFFSVTRNLIKDIPASKIDRKDTQKLVKLSVDILNFGIRPHLTRWQAKFRKWYEQRLETSTELTPQELQKKYPEYEVLVEDMIRVNQSLIEYSHSMHQLYSGFKDAESISSNAVT